VIGALGSPLGPHPESDLDIDPYSGPTPIANMVESDRWISFKEFMSSLPIVVEALGSPLGPHPESDLATNLYSISTPIANMDESYHRISFNCLNKSMILLSAAIGALGSPLGPHLKRDLAIDLYSVSTPIANMDEFDHWISFR
jgi:hypothetical protein